jgi:hypothetical protein
MMVAAVDQRDPTGRRQAEGGLSPKAPTIILMGLFRCAAWLRPR